VLLKLQCGIYSLEREEERESFVARYWNLSKTRAKEKVLKKFDNKRRSTNSEVSRKIVFLR